jgi:hypothetical protein
MKEKLTLTTTSKIALCNVMERAIAQNQRCGFNPSCTQAPNTILKIMNGRQELYLTPCIRCAIMQFAEAHGDEEDRFGLVEVYQALFDTDASTADKILGQLNPV